MPYKNNESCGIKIDILLVISTIMKRITFYTFLLIYITACSSNDDLNNNPTSLDTELENLLSSNKYVVGKNNLVFPKSWDLAKIPQDPNNPITKDKVELGKLLFHETAIARNPLKLESLKTYSCSSCHSQKAGYQAGIPQGMGEGGVGYGVKGERRVKNKNYSDNEVDVQPVRSPSALNIAYQTNILWNGQFGGTHLNVGTEASWTKGTPKEKNFYGYQGVETQAIAGQDVHRLNISKTFLDEQPVYKELFKKAFPNMNLNDNLEIKINAGLAVAAYERTLLATEAPFQLWLNGNYNALSEEQKQGAILFFGKGECVNCHNGPSLAAMNFYALGLNDLKNGSYGNNTVVAITDNKPEFLGRGGFTGNSKDNYKFKVPQLYNLKDSPFYGHGASFTDIESIIRYKNEGIKQNIKVPISQLSPDFKPLNLTENEIKQISDFVKNGLYDSNLSRFEPSSLPSGLFFPNNDYLSRLDEGK